MTVKNFLILGHSDVDKLKDVLKSFAQGHLFGHFAPMPREIQETMLWNLNPQDQLGQMTLKNQREITKEFYGYSDWYDFAMSKWGCRGDVGQSFDILGRLVDNVAMMSFFTSDYAPWEALSTMHRQGYSVESYFLRYRGHMLGAWINGIHWVEDIPDNIENLKNTYPPNVWDDFGLYTYTQ